MCGMAGQEFHGGDVLRKLRGKIPKTKFAKKAGITRQTVARFEEAPAKAQPETIRRIAAALKMTPVELKEAMGLDERTGVQPQEQQSDAPPFTGGEPPPSSAIDRPPSDARTALTTEAETMTVTVTDAELQMITAVRGLNKKRHHAFARAVSAMVEEWVAGQPKRRRLVR